MTIKKTHYHIEGLDLFPLYALSIFKTKQVRRAFMLDDIVLETLAILRRNNPIFLIHPLFTNDTKGTIIPLTRKSINKDSLSINTGERILLLNKPMRYKTSLGIPCIIAKADSKEVMRYMVEDDVPTYLEYVKTLNRK